MACAVRQIGVLEKSLDRNRAGTSASAIPTDPQPPQEITDRIEAETGVRVLIWLGSNFGACDIPLGLNRMGVDLLISWGHNKFNKKIGW